MPDVRLLPNVRSCSTLLCCSLLFLAACKENGRAPVENLAQRQRDAMARLVRDAILAAPNVEVFVLEPRMTYQAGPGALTFHSWRVCGRFAVTDPSSASALRQAIAQDLRAGKGEVYACEVLPDFGVSFWGGPRSIDVLLDYGCGDVSAYLSGSDDSLGNHRVPPPDTARGFPLLIGLLEAHGMAFQPARASRPAQPNPGMQRTRYARR